MKRRKRQGIALAAEPASWASCSSLRARDRPHERERVELSWREITLFFMLLHLK